MDVYLIDGTYELFRHYYAVPSAQDDSGQEIGAVRGVLNSVLSLLASGSNYVGVATDHVVESFRNDLYPYYKTSEGVPPELLSQFPIVEEWLDAMGIVVWPMIEFEADDALASAAAKAAGDRSVDRVIICTPDKDLCQCVSGDRIVLLDRRRQIFLNAEGVVTKFGVRPESIPDYLALVGDTADGYPGLAGWGAKAASSVLSVYTHIEDIPKDVQAWHPAIRNARKLASTLFASWSDALLYRTLATLRTDAPTLRAVEDIRWRRPGPKFADVCNRLKAPKLFERAMALAELAESSS